MAREMKDSGVEWIGEIPREWYCHSLKVIIIQNDGGIWGDDPIGDDGDIVLRSTEQTIDGKWDIVSPAKRDLSKISNKICYICKKNDLLITKSSGSNLHIGKTTIVDDIIEEMQCYYSNFIQRIRLSQAVSAKYYWYILNSDIARSQFTYMQNTTSGIGNINAKHIANLIVPKPPVQEQYCIENYLNVKCAEIDNVIEKTYTSIEEYRKLKQAVITQAVTKGIRGDREMKDSDIEWIGDIPRDWEVNTAFQLFTQVKNRNIDLREKNLLSLSYGKIKQKSIDTVKGLLPENFESYNIVEQEDIVLRLTDLQNDHKSLRVGFVTERGIVTSAYCTIRVKGVNNGKYLYYFLHSFDIAKGFYGMGAGVRQGLNWDGMKKLKIIVPSLEEQQEIVNYLDQKCSVIDNHIAKKEQYLFEIENYKKSLIYEYVTGKKEVPQEY